MKNIEIRKKIYALIDRIENEELLQSLLRFLQEPDDKPLGQHLIQLYQQQQQQDDIISAYEEKDEEQKNLAKEDFMALDSGAWDIETTKLELIQLVLRTEKAAVLEKVKSVLNEESEDWWDELSDKEKREIELGLQDVENGNVVDHEEVKKLFRK